MNSFTAMNSLGHQKGTDEVIEGNHLADLIAKEAARTPWGPKVTEALLTWDNFLQGTKSQYIQEETKQALDHGYVLHQSGCFNQRKGSYLSLPLISGKILKTLH
jgi:hypothetical protein